MSFARAGSSCRKNRLNFAYHASGEKLSASNNPMRDRRTAPIVFAASSIPGVTTPPPTCVPSFFSSSSSSNC